MKNKWYANIFMAIMMLGSIYTGFAFTDSKQDENVIYHEVQVGWGDTLWSLARPYVNDHDDIREVVYRIKELNQIHDVGDIQPGMTIRIPQKVIPNDSIYVAGM